MSIVVVAIIGMVVIAVTSIVTSCVWFGRRERELGQIREGIESLRSLQAAAKAREDTLQ